MSLTPSAVLLIVERHKQDLESSLASTSADPYLQRITLQRIQNDLPHLLRALNDSKAAKHYDAALKQLNALSDLADEQAYKIQKAKERQSASKQKKLPQQALSVNQSVSDLATNENAEEDYMSLRKRLLADGTSTSLDDQNKSTDQMNDYHETFQEDLIKDLSGLASALKTSAFAFSSKVTEDTKVLDETGENMMKSLTLMQTVGSNLNGYLNEKSGGKISIFFLIKTMIAIVVIFFIALILINFLPKM